MSLTHDIPYQLAELLRTLAHELPAADFYDPYSCDRVAGRYTLNTGRSAGPQLSARQRKSSAKSPVSAPPRLQKAAPP